MVNPIIPGQQQQRSINGTGQPMQSHDTLDLETWLSPQMFMSELGPLLAQSGGTTDSGVLQAPQIAEPLQAMVAPIITSDSTPTYCASTAMVLTPESMAPPYDSYPRSPIDLASPVDGPSTVMGASSQTDGYKTYPQDSAGYSGGPRVADAMWAAIVAAEENLNRLQAEASRVPGFMHAMGHQTLVHQENPPPPALSSAAVNALKAAGLIGPPEMEGQAGESIFQGATGPYRNEYRPLRTTAAAVQRGQMQVSANCSSSSSPSIQNLQVYFPPFCSGNPGMQLGERPNNSAAGCWPYVANPDTLGISRPPSSVSNRPPFPDIDVAPGIAVPGNRVYGVMCSMAPPPSLSVSRAPQQPSRLVADSSGYGNACVSAVQKNPSFLAASCASSIAGEEDTAMMEQQQKQQQSLLGGGGDSAFLGAAGVTRDTQSNSTEAHDCGNSSAPDEGRQKGGRKRKSPDTTSGTGTTSPAMPKAKRSRRRASRKTEQSDNPDSASKRFRLTDDQKRCFYTWVVKNINNPYPSEDDRENDLAVEGISKQRFKWWFSNHRHRSLRAVEDDAGNTTFVPRLSFYKACAKLGVDIDWPIPDDISAKLNGVHK